MRKFSCETQQTPGLYHINFKKCGEIVLTFNSHISLPEIQPPDLISESLRCNGDTADRDLGRHGRTARLSFYTRGGG